GISFGGSFLATQTVTPPHTNAISAMSAYREKGLGSIGALFVFHRGRRLIAEFAMADLAAGPRDPYPEPNRHERENERRQRERQLRLRPLDRRNDRGQRETGKRIKHKLGIIGAIGMSLEPGLAVVIAHREDAVISLLAKFDHRPRGRRAKEDQ